MTKVKRSILVYMLMIRKRMFVFSNSNMFLDKKFEVTEEQIRKVAIAQDKAEKILETCETVEQLLTLQRYCGMLYARYPFASIIYRILLIKINDFVVKPMTVDGVTFSNPRFSEDDVNKLYLNQEEVNKLITQYTN